MIAVGFLLGWCPSAIPQSLEGWPPPGVHKLGEAGLTAPRLLKDVKPQYTAAAMRANVQGAVIIECVVDVDGSVGAVRVRRSLDPTFGLDEEAMKTAKQWRFQPAVKDGMPVQVVVSIQLTFTLGKIPTSVPAAFARSAGDTTKVPALDEPWTDKSVESDGWRLTMSYPSSWLPTASSRGNLLQVVGVRGASRFTFVSLPALKPAAFSLREGLIADKLQQFESAEKASLPSRVTGASLGGVGQIQVESRYWLWESVRHAPMADVRLPQTLVPDLLRMDPIDLWVFNTTEADRLIQINLAVAVPKGSPRDQTEFDEHAAADIFVEMLKRFRIERAN